MNNFPRRAHKCPSGRHQRLLTLALTKPGGEAKRKRNMKPKNTRCEANEHRMCADEYLRTVDVYRGDELLACNVLLCIDCRHRRNKSYEHKSYRDG